MQIDQQRGRPAIVQHEIRHQRHLARARRLPRLTDQPFDEKPRWIELRIGSSDTRFVLFTFDEQGLQPGGRSTARWPGQRRTDVSELVAMGVGLVTPPQKQRWGTFAMFKDPDGTQFMLSSRQWATSSGV